MKINKIDILIRGKLFNQKKIPDTHIVFITTKIRSPALVEN